MDPKKFAAWAYKEAKIQAVIEIIKNDFLKTEEALTAGSIEDVTQLFAESFFPHERVFKSYENLLAAGMAVATWCMMNQALLAAFAADLDKDESSQYANEAALFASAAVGFASVYKQAMSEPKKLTPTAVDKVFNANRLKMVDLQRKELLK